MNLQELEQFNELRGDTLLTSILTFPSFNAPGYELTGGMEVCCGVNDAIAEIEPIVWTAGYKNSPEHEWKLVSYEVFVPQKMVLVAPDNMHSCETATIHNAVIFCYYSPIKPEVINQLIQQNQPWVLDKSNS
ncbi:MULTISPECIES: hypothetical protein [Nostoc]|uniref:Uncharacterized protein n=1 Tax=Nostoc paludosum FACHB-159 TaxID=2692908 RepID=A0ABR8KJZ5_9NOSO|nr:MULTISPECIES: hypothetical protein [Nostoc]MBD2682877.1 hypothetical protein [Nostoc sp. FACHB-857]MBD2739214.1 hypothetical protein [Nostoc paludosum FACHB-159]